MGWRSTRHRRKRRFPTRTRISLRPIRRPWCVSLRCRLPIRCVTTTKPRAKHRLAAAWPTRRRRACSGSVSAESSEKVAIYGSPLWTVLIVCGLLLAIKAIALLGLAGMAAHRNASLPDGRRSRRLPGKAALTSKAPETSRRRPSPNRWASKPIHCSRWAGEADYAAFSGVDVTQEHAERYWHDIAEERKFMLGSLPTFRRWRAKLSLADVFHFRKIRLRKIGVKGAGLMNVKHIEVGLNSNIGLRRKDNQDSACASHGVYVVCDGMGGGKGRQEASSGCCGTVRAFGRTADARS